MKEGWWINFRNDKMFGPLDEHERYLREGDNAKKMGIPQNVIDRFDQFEPVKDRDKLLLFVMQHSPLMRVRGHGVSTTFEYSSHERSAPLDSIFLFAKNNLGPYSDIVINNFATRESANMNFADFEETMDRGGAEAVMRTASILKMRMNRRIAKELLEIAKLLK